MNRKKIRKLTYLLSTWFEPKKKLNPSAEPIDVIIPVVDKDLKILPLCLEALKKNLLHPVRSIYLVAPPTPTVIDFCSQNNLTFVSERTVLGYGTEQINYRLGNGDDRSGWIFQQLLKLSGTIGTSPYFLVIDADHILIRPHLFLTTDRKTVFYRSREYHEPYYTSMQKLLGKIEIPRLSYVAHKMLFSREELKRLKNLITLHTGKPWDRAILESLDTHEHASFSEYETYGIYFPIPKKESLLFRNKSLSYRNLDTVEGLAKKYAPRYRAVTFPDYKNR